MFVLINNRIKSARRPQTTMAGATGDDAEGIPGHSAGRPPGNSLTCTHLYTPVKIQTWIVCNNLCIAGSRKWMSYIIDCCHFSVTLMISWHTPLQVKLIE